MDRRPAHFTHGQERRKITKGKKMHFAKILIGTVLASAGTALFAANTAAASTAAKACEANFSVEGSTATGKVYVAHASVRGVVRPEAVTRAANKVTTDGLVVMTADADAGLVVATNRVSNGKGETSTLEIKIKEMGGGQLNVALRFPIRAGLVSSDAVIRDAMCQVVAAIEQ